MEGSYQNFTRECQICRTLFSCPTHFSHEQICEQCRTKICYTWNAVGHIASECPKTRDNQRRKECQYCMQVYYGNAHDWDLYHYQRLGAFEERKQQFHGFHNDHLDLQNSQSICVYCQESSGPDHFCSIMAQMISQESSPAIPNQSDQIQPAQYSQSQFIDLTGISNVPDMLPWEKCGQLLPETDMADHMLAHEFERRQSMKKCQICGQMLAEADMRDHMVAHQFEWMNSNRQERPRQHEYRRPAPRRRDIQLNHHRPNRQIQFQADQAMDYESLQALDDHFAVGNGLNRQQIENYPSRVMQEESKENCMICMETIKPNEVARRLPWTHEFHAEWIDEWLSRNATCPIDKEKV